MDDTTQPGPARSPSVIAPISLAIDRVGRILFKPFDPAVWFVLGFCAWLARLGEGGGSGGGTNYSSDSSGYGSAFSGVSDWTRAHLGLAIVIGVALLTIIVALVVLILWLSSRGKLMFVDGVINERAAVVEPWHRFRKQGNSLFLFRLAFSLVAMLVFGVLGGLLWGTLVATGVRGGDEFGAAGLLVLVPWLAVTFGVALVTALVALFTNDFVVPVMWLHGCGAVEGWRRLLPLLSDHAGSIVLYVLIKLLLGVVLIALSVIGCCMSLCLVLIPYLGTVLLMPIHVFRRSYSLEFLGQLGGPYTKLVTPMTVERLPEPGPEPEPT